MQESNPFSQQIQEKLLTYSQEEQLEEQQKTRYKGSKLKDLFPTNYFEEMSQFFKHKAQYNPHFEYNTVVAPELGEVHHEYESLANKILVNNTYPASQETLLTEEEVLVKINQYLEKIGLENYVETLFSTQCLSRTSVLYYKNRIVLKIRMPLSYTKTSLQGTLNHEIGTHIVRYLNHKENTQRKPTKKSKIFEEGLATINQLLPQEKPMLFKAALRYNAVIQASKASFSEVYKFISKYIKDQTDCWRETVRAKRGLINTEKHGAYTKDQNYLVGAIQILKNRKSIDFQRCFYSKLSAQEGKNIEKGVLPPFMQSQQKKQGYLKRIEVIALCNFVDFVEG